MPEIASPNSNTTRDGTPVFSLFLSVICFRRNLSKCFISHGDCPFALNRLPCFSWKISLFPGKNRGRRRSAISRTSFKVAGKLLDGPPHTL